MLIFLRIGSKYALTNFLLLISDFKLVNGSFPDMGGPPYPILRILEKIRSGKPGLFPSIKTPPIHDKAQTNGSTWGTSIRLLPGKSLGSILVNCHPKYAFDGMLFLWLGI